MKRGLTAGTLVVHDHLVAGNTTRATTCGCSSVVEHLLAKERVESSNLFIRLFSIFGSAVAEVQHW